MTNQEAINIIKTAIAQVEWDYPMECAAALDKAIEALEKREAPDNGGWISVKDRLPEESKNVLVYCKGGYMSSVSFSHMWKAFNHFDSQGDPTEGDNHCFLDVTHWMPMPEPPEEEEMR